MPFQVGRPGDSGSAQVFGLLGAGLAFLAVVAVLLLQAARPGTEKDAGNPNREAGQDLDAGLLAAILSSPGIGWGAGADAVIRLGLGANNGSGLDPERVAALHGALLATSAPNGKIDYPDARASLGLPASEEFNLTLERTSPPTWSPEDLSGKRAAYIGDWVSLGILTVPPGSSSAVQAMAQSAINGTMGIGAATERRALLETGLQFNDLAYVSQAEPTIRVSVPGPDPPLLSYLNVSHLEGDVYPDIKQYISANLLGRLPLYQVLVVGSNIDQTALTPAEVKQGIADWVQAGGRLLVLGSDSQSATWLQPLFSVSETSVSGPVTASDSGDILLEWPFPLDWEGYDTHGRAWSLHTTGANAHFNDFRHVLLQGGKDVFAITKNGTFGAGGVALTSFRPYELGAPEDTHLLVNMAVPEIPTKYDFSYGPAPPLGVAVSAFEKSTHVWDPALGFLHLRVTLRVWDAP